MAQSRQKPTPAGVLHPSALYVGDNGRAFCGKLRCAGMTAYFTGRDISGQRVARVRPAEALRWGIACESCEHVIHEED